MEDETPLKLFTPKEATQTLPLVKRIVVDMLEIGQHIRTLSVEPGEKNEAEKELSDAIDQLDELIEELESLGCFYKDWNFSVGLVDFPSVINNKEVLLCWRSDEDEIKYYHDLETGFDGRKPIPATLFK